MTRTLAALIATLLVLPGASYQDDPKADKEKAKDQPKADPKPADAPKPDTAKAKEQPKKPGDKVSIK